MGSVSLNNGITATALTLTRNDGTSSSYGGTLAFDGLNANANGDSLIKDGNYTQTLAGTSANLSLPASFPTTVAVPPPVAFTVKHGVLQLSKTAGVDALGVGEIAVTGGSLQLLAANQINDADVMILSGHGKFDMNGSSEAFTGLSGQRHGGTSNANSTLTLGSTSNNVSSTFSGVIQNTAGNLGLTKIGGGTLTLSGANTYTGTTTINAARPPTAPARLPSTATPAAWPPRP